MATPRTYVHWHYDGMDILSSFSLRGSITNILNLLKFGNRLIDTVPILFNKRDCLLDCEVVGC